MLTTYEQARSNNGANQFRFMADLHNNMQKSDADYRLVLAKDEVSDLVFGAHGSTSIIVTHSGGAAQSKGIALGHRLASITTKPYLLPTVKFEGADNVNMVRHRFLLTPSTIVAHQKFAKRIRRCATQFRPSLCRAARQR